MTTPSTLAVYLRMTVATALLGSYLVAGKVILADVPVFTATFVRLVAACAVLAPYLWFRSRRRAPGVRPAPLRPGRRDGAVLLAQTVLGVFLFSVFAMYGVTYTGAIEAGVILGTVPVSITLVAVLLLGETVGGRRGLGIALAVAGAVGVNVLSDAEPGAGPGARPLLGALLLVCAVLCEAVFMTFGRLLVTPVPPATLSLLLSAAGAVLFAVPAAIEFDGAALLALSWRTWALMIYSGVAVNGIAAVLMYESLDHVDTTVAAAFTALTPVSGAVLATLFLGERLYPHHVAGMALVVAGVFVVAGGPRRRTRDTRPPTRRRSSASGPRTTETGAIRVVVPVLPVRRRASRSGAPPV